MWCFVWMIHSAGISQPHNHVPVIVSLFSVGTNIWELDLEVWRISTGSVELPDRENVLQRIANWNHRFSIIFIYALMSRTLLQLPQCHSITQSSHCFYHLTIYSDLIISQLYMRKQWKQAYKSFYHIIIAMLYLIALISVNKLSVSFISFSSALHNIEGIPCPTQGNVLRFSNAGGLM